MDYTTEEKYREKIKFNQIILNPTDTNFYKDQLEKYQSKRIQKLIEIRAKRQQEKAKEQLDRIIRSKGIVIGAVAVRQRPRKVRGQKPTTFYGKGIEKHSNL